MGSDARPAGTPPTVGDSASEIASATSGGRDPRFWLELSSGQVQDLAVQEAESRGGGRGLLWVVLALNGRYQLATRWQRELRKTASASLSGQSKMSLSVDGGQAR